jgi:hypothetical protein
MHAEFFVSEHTSTIEKKMGGNIKMDFILISLCILFNNSLSTNQFFVFVIEFVNKK